MSTASRWHRSRRAASQRDGSDIRAPREALPLPPGGPPQAIIDAGALELVAEMLVGVVDLQLREALVQAVYTSTLEFAPAKDVLAQAPSSIRASYGERCSPANRPPATPRPQTSGTLEALTRQLNDKSLPPRSRRAVMLTLWSLGAHPPLKAQLADAGAIETLVAFAKAGVALPPPTQPRNPPPLPSSSSRPRPLRSLPSPPPPSPQLPCLRQGALAQRRAAAGGF